MELLRDPNSESESEPEHLKCRGQEVLYQEGNAVYQLTKERCRRRARGEPTQLLVEDADKSSIRRGRSCQPLLEVQPRVPRTAVGKEIRACGLYCAWAGHRVQRQPRLRRPGSRARR